MRNYRLHLIRHGLIEANFTGQYIGQLDVPLCKRGVRELVEQKEQADYPLVGRVYVSPLQRCRQTAQILYPQQDVVVVDALAECHFGVFEGKTAGELRDDPDFALWLADSAAHPPKGGESTQEFQLRCLRGFQSIFEDMMREKIYSAAAVTHAGWISTLLASIAFPRREVSYWRSKAGEGYTVLISPDLWMRGQTVEIYDTVPSLERHAPREADQE